MFNNSCTAWEPRNLLHTGHVIHIYAALYMFVGTFSLIGNSTIVFLVLARSELRTGMNIFVANLAVSDLLVTVSSFWINPVITYYQVWLFGESACYFWSYLSTASILICTFTLTAIALDRYMLIVHPFNRPMRTVTCVVIMIIIWTIGTAATIPIVLNTEYISIPLSTDCFHTFEFCGESGWNSTRFRIVYGAAMFSLKTLIPFGLIAYSYGRIARKLHVQHLRFLHIRSASNRVLEIMRLQRMQKILIAMVVVFAICSCPSDLLHLIEDVEFAEANVGYKVFSDNYRPLIMVTTHFVAMTATLWNPLLYAGLNENFRRELLQTYNMLSISSSNGRAALHRLSSSVPFPSLRKISSSLGFTSIGIFREDSRNVESTNTVIAGRKKWTAKAANLHGPTSSLCADTLVIRTNDTNDSMASVQGKLKLAECVGLQITPDKSNCTDQKFGDMAGGPKIHTASCVKKDECNGERLRNNNATEQLCKVTKHSENLVNNRTNYTPLRNSMRYSMKIENRKSLPLMNGFDKDIEFALQPKWSLKKAQKSKDLNHDSNTKQFTIQKQQFGWSKLLLDLSPIAMETENEDIHQNLCHNGDVLL